MTDSDLDQVPFCPELHKEIRFDFEGYTLRARLLEDRHGRYVRLEIKNFHEELIYNLNEDELSLLINKLSDFRDEVKQ